MPSPARSTSDCSSPTSFSSQLSPPNTFLSAPTSFSPSPTSFLPSPTSFSPSPTSSLSELADLNQCAMTHLQHHQDPANYYDYYLNPGDRSRLSINRSITNKLEEGGGGGGGVGGGGGGEQECPPPPPAPAASPLPNPSLLSAPSSAGSGSTKVSKRRSRAVTKPPITVLSADRSTFRAMVQKLTGIPTPSPSTLPLHPHMHNTTTTTTNYPHHLHNLTFQQLLQSNFNHLLGGAASYPPAPGLLSPFLNHSAMNNNVINSLPTLDTSSSFLALNGSAHLASSPPPSTSSPPPPPLSIPSAGCALGNLNPNPHPHPHPFLHPHKLPLHATTPLGLFADHTFTQGMDVQSLLAAGPEGSFNQEMHPDLQQQHDDTLAKGAGNGFHGLINLSEVEQLHKLRQAAELESLLMLRNLDSWLTSDPDNNNNTNHTVHHHRAPIQMELAHSA